MLHAVILHGDQTGEDLLVQALRFFDEDVLHTDVKLDHFDLSLTERERTANAVVRDAADALSAVGVGLKAATITPEGQGTVGSPNRLLREGIDGKVIVRQGRRLPGVPTITGLHHPVAVIRMAVGDAYGAEELRAEDGSWAQRTETITRDVCRAVSEYAFQHARGCNGVVFGGPKWTVSPVYEGLLKEEMDEAADRHPEVPYRPILVDALYAALVSGAPDRPLVIPSLNRDGDCLSDLVLPMFGSIAGAESVLLSLDGEDLSVKTAMAEAPHGTAPALEGKDVANPLAMLLAAAATLKYGGYPDRSRWLTEACMDALAAGTRTHDLGGHSSCSGYTNEVLERFKLKRDLALDKGLSR